jgi:hypothetical protein
MAAMVFAALPAVTLFPFKELGSSLSPSALFPQAITNQVMVWALLVGAMSATLLTIWHFGVARKKGATLDDYGLTWEGRVSWPKVGKSFLLAFLMALSAYLSLLLSSLLFTVDFRFWVFAVKPMSPLQLRISLSYLIPFTAFFLVYGVVLFGQLRRGLSPVRELVLVVALSTLGFAGLMVFQYLPLFMGGTLAIPTEALWSIITLQFVPLMAMAGLVTAYFQRKTGHVWVGAFLSGILVSWIVVAGQATHFGF